MSDTNNNDDPSRFRPKNLNGGRKRLFPDSNITKRTVTLPNETWDYIFSVDPSISRAIFEIANDHQQSTP